MIAKVIKENQRDWSEWVPYVTFRYNATVHSSTGFSLFFIFSGRQPLCNVDLIFSLSPEGALTVPQYATEVVERLDKANALVRNHLQAAADSASRWCNN